MNSVDIFVQTHLSHIRTTGVTEFMYLVSRIFDVSIYSVAITILIAVLIYYVREKKYALLFAFSMLFGAVISVLLKLFFNIPRPSGAIFSAFGQSFPSYHAVIVTIFFSTMIFIFDDYLEGFWRKSFNFLCVLGIILVSFSRLYLGVHWLSDVLAGILIGFVVYCASIYIFRKTNHFHLKDNNRLMKF